jgi:hypothetical protein
VKLDCSDEFEAKSKKAFLVSCVNHHISILKLTVHTAYIEYLETGKLPDEDWVGEDWSSPVLERTQWYDLIKPSDRAEAFRALWGVTGYISRYKY